MNSVLIRTYKYVPIKYKFYMAPRGNGELTTDTSMPLEQGAAELRSVAEAARRSMQSSRRDGIPARGDIS